MSVIPPQDPSSWGRHASLVSLACSQEPESLSGQDCVHDQSMRPGATNATWLRWDAIFDENQLALGTGLSPHGCTSSASSNQAHRVNSACCGLEGVSPIHRGDFNVCPSECRHARVRTLFCVQSSQCPQSCRCATYSHWVNHDQMPLGGTRSIRRRAP